MENKTKIDYVTVSCEERLATIEQSVREIYRGAVAEPFFTEGAGLDYFDKRADISVVGVHVGTMMWGGKSQKGRARLDIKGNGCSLVPDWERAEEVLLALPGRVFRRGDIAADFYRGEVDHQRVVDAHEAGQFCRGEQGRPPKLRRILSSDENDGLTCYVGVRGGDKLLRCYEKGKKEFGGSSFRMVRELTDSPRGVQVTDTGLNDGKPFDLGDWYRVELEWRSAKGAIPCDWMARRDEYFAGSYPFTAELMPEVEGRILVTPKMLGILSVERALEVMAKQWGPTLFTALVVHGGDILAVWDKIVGSRHSRRLVEAGALLALYDEGSGASSELTVQASESLPGWMTAP